MCEQAHLAITCLLGHPYKWRRKTLRLQGTDWYDSNAVFAQMGKSVPAMTAKARGSPIFAVSTFEAKSFSESAA